ncbi:murein L,D-transpeptidase [Pannonibacter phragmitetus]|uniref:Murein L,D-transpeptidase n=1 Tax=Pannonibacter phragmitetus TaxID=121719 RepID=A0A378ZW97_9HYPH|nr:L,D-transpeptidase family protein [Pannonibacter phragmitetus]SUB01273.1 murein L,D-transpeptidase [Pannonibacter phragmitetus]
MRHTLQPARFLSTLLASAAIASLTLTASVQPAAAFLDRIFGGRPVEEPQPVLPAPAPVLDKAVIAANKVSAPKYYTYKADQLAAFSLKALAASPQPAAGQTPGGAASGGTGAVLPVSAQAVAPQAAADQTGSIDSPAGHAAALAFDAARPAFAALSFKALPEVAKAVEAFYAQEPRFVWVENGAPGARFAALKSELERAGDFGLDPADYRVEAPALTGLEPAARDAALVDFEVKASIAALTYVLDARRGRVDPNRISGYHDLPRHKVDLTAEAKGLAAAADAGQYLRSRQLASPQFTALVEELARLKRETSDTPQVVIAAGTLLKPGKSSPEVKNVVAAIRLRGSAALLEAHKDLLDTYMGEELYSDAIEDLVKAYQAEAGLNADGVVGAGTIQALTGESNASKIAKVELALERMRWLPENLGERRVFINQPAFTVAYFEPGKAPLEMRAVIGKKSNQTNFFYDTIETVEYNPYWGVPYSIIVNEKLSKLQQDPAWLDKAGYEVTTVAGKPVSSASVDWHAVATGKMRVNVRQRPGDDNALGELKILFPNKHAIYMHDTPSRSLFKKDMRAFSHGCVRLADPRAMAAAVLGKTEAHVASRIATGKNNSEDVAGNIPVYIAYFTAWPQTDGSIGYFGDVYDRDAYLQKALEATRKARGTAES